MAAKKRTAKLKRKTRETDISVEINLDGTGKSSVSTGMPFMDHMLEAMSSHSLIDMTIKAKGDLDVDLHHTVEDLGLVLGSALDEALGTRKGITRFGSFILPMDETLAEVAVDLGGRPYMVYNVNCRTRKIRDFELYLFKEFFQGFMVQARMNLHINQRYGKEPHHCYEAIFKGLARALRIAVSKDPRITRVPSSKGKI